MSAHCNFQVHSPLKKVLNKIEDSYHTYIISYKTHAMTTHYGGIGKLSENDSDTQEMMLLFTMNTGKI